MGDFRCHFVGGVRLLSRLLRPTAPPVALGLAIAAFFIVAESIVVVVLPRRVFQHAADEAPPDELGRCTACGAAPAPRDTMIAPGPGPPAPSSDDDVVTAALARPHLLLTPVR